MVAPAPTCPSRARTLRSGAWLGAVVVTALAVLLVAACASSGPSSSSSQRQVERVLEESGFPKATATCATRQMYAALSEAELTQLVVQAGSGADAVDGALRQKVADAVRSCVATSSDSGATPNTESVGASTTTTSR